MRVRSIVTVVGVLAFSARAEDPKSDSLTVMPWTNANFTFGSKDKRAAVEYSQGFPRALSLWLKASAPLDEETRTAAFTNENSLVSGFAGQVQFGWDGRMRAIQELSDHLVVAQKALGELRTLPRFARTDALVTYAQGHGIAANATAFIQYLCKDGSCPTELRALLKFQCEARWAGQDCAKIAGTEGDSFAAAVTAAERYLRSNCQGLASATEDNCLSAQVLGDLTAKEIASRRLETFIKTNQDSLWSTLEFVDPTLCAEVKKEGKTALVLADNLGKIESAFRQFLANGPVSKRDMLLTSAMASQRTEHAIVADLAFSYDQQKVFQDDVSATATKAEQMQLTLGANYTTYLARGFSSNVRAGYELKQEAGAKKFERCSALTGNASITGKQCDGSALFRTGGAPPAQSSAYVRVAIDYQWVDNGGDDKLIPGIEVRAGIDGIGAAKAVNARLTLFGTPVKGNLAARAGVALDFSYALDVPNGPPVTVTPMVFLGATFADLMGR